MIGAARVTVAVACPDCGRQRRVGADYVRKMRRGERAGRCPKCAAKARKVPTRPVGPWSRSFKPDPSWMTAAEVESPKRWARRVWDGLLPEDRRELREALCGSTVLDRSRPARPSRRSRVSAGLDFAGERRDAA